MQITRRMEIDAGHRLVGHESKCAHVHGHRYAFELTVEADELDDVGRVIDFGAIKATVGAWLDDNWDHAMIVNVTDGPLVDWLRENAQRYYIVRHNPTAEYLAKYLAIMAEELLSGSGLRVVRVVCHETPNCSATYEVPRG